MNFKRRISIILAILLMVLQGSPAAAMTMDKPPEQEQGDTKTTIETDIETDIETNIETDIETEAEIEIDTDTHQEEEPASPSEARQPEITDRIEDDEMPPATTWSLPATPPGFSAEIESTFEGYVLKETFTEFHPDTVQVYPLYSWDGEVYEPIGEDGETMNWDLDMLGTEDPWEQEFMQTQICAYASDEPMESFLQQKQDRFYVKLEITLESGERYETQADVIEQGMSQLPPENTTFDAAFSASMRAVEKEQTSAYTYGKYQITVKENVTSEEMYALLPETVPVEIQIAESETNKVITSGIVDCEVAWKEIPALTLNAGMSFIIRDAAHELVIPSGTEVSTPLGIYILPENFGFENLYARDEIRIVVNVIEKEETPDISLIENRNTDLTNGSGPLSLAFRLKPSGADSIKAYSYVEGETEWTEICELLDLRAVDANQSEKLYGYVDILQPDESPYQEYLKGDNTGFMIGIMIEGGTFDGERVLLPWPGAYTPPPQIPELGGAGGNENNAGSGETGSGNNGGGQRPGHVSRPDKGEASVPLVTSNNPELPLRHHRWNLQHQVHPQIRCQRQTAENRSQTFLPKFPYGMKSHHKRNYRQNHYQYPRNR